MMKVHKMSMKVLVSLCFLLASLTGVCPQRDQEIYVKAGEMVAMQCPYFHNVVNHNDANLTWTSYTTQGIDLTDIPPAEQRQMGVLVHGRSLVILSASVNHEGNYSCSLGNVRGQFWLRLMVTTTQNRYNETCNIQESCTLNCPDENTPGENIENITSNGTGWHKQGESVQQGGYFPSVKESDHGVYTCTRTYLYHGQIYNMTFTVVLDVQTNKKSMKFAVITSPQMNDTIYVELGSSVVVDCKAVTYSDSDVYWLSGESFVDTNDSLPVFYNYTDVTCLEGVKMTASLVFRSISEKDLSKNYTCKLESDIQSSTSVTITLKQKLPSPRPSYLSLAVGVVCIVMVMVLTAVIYLKFKMNITLFLRDTLGCRSSTSDGKNHDAFLMCYKSNTEAGLNERDRKELKSVLEDRFGYSLCLYDRDVLPGTAVAEGVLGCIEQSRAVVLVPASSDHCLGSSLLSAIHAALVERQTRLVFIKTEAEEVSRSGSVPEALQLLAKAGDCVTWKGLSSMSPSSSFWKQLRYHLPAPQHAAKIKLLP